MLYQEAQKLDAGVAGAADDADFDRLLCHRSTRFNDNDPTDNKAALRRLCR
jgi:hypothetical protein